MSKPRQVCYPYRCSKCGGFSERGSRASRCYLPTKRVVRAGVCCQRVVEAKCGGRIVRLPGKIHRPAKTTLSVFG